MLPGLLNRYIFDISMKAHFLSFIFLSTVFSYGQFYNPSVVVLDPHEREYDSLLLKEITEFDYQGYTNPEYEKAFMESI